MDTNRYFVRLCALLFCALLPIRAAETNPAGHTEAKGVKDAAFHSEYVPNQLLVKFRPQSTRDSEVAELLEATERMQETRHPGASTNGEEAGAVVTKSLGRLNKQFRVRKSEKGRPRRVQRRCRVQGVLREAREHGRVLQFCL